MSLFQPDTRYDTPRHQEVWGFYERIYTVVDVAAGMCFVVGSVMFFFEAWQIPGTWLFLLGSIFFVAKPTIRLLREFHLARLPLPGDDDA